VRNERLREAMAAAGYSEDRLAETLGVDPKSVWRWARQGVVPRRVGMKRKVADLLGVAEGQIWPVSTEAQVVDPGDTSEEVVCAWSHRADVPKSRWWALFSEARQCIDLLGYAMQFLPEDHARFDRLLLDKAGSGCAVRIALAHPESRYVLERDAEERLGGTFPDRIRSTLDHFKPLFGVDGIEIRHHQTPMYNSLFRSDDEMLVTPHLFALKGYRAPIFLLRRAIDDGIFDNFAEHFERIWAETEAIG
jgi:transcriptional regulator with XRE-family HTH domain